jgi:hypothetical protein
MRHPKNICRKARQRLVDNRALYRQAVIILLVSSAPLFSMCAIAGERGRKPMPPSRPVLGISRSGIARTAFVDATDDDQLRNDSSTHSRAAAKPDRDGQSAALEGLLREDVTPPVAEELMIDLPAALQLAEAENPTIALGRQAIVEAVALQTAARG